MISTCSLRYFESLFISDFSFDSLNNIIAIIESIVDAYFVVSFLFISIVVHLDLWKGYERKTIHRVGTLYVFSNVYNRGEQGNLTFPYSILTLSTLFTYLKIRILLLG